jgi:hypothetical protein
MQEGNASPSVPPSSQHLFPPGLSFSTKILHTQSTRAVPKGMPPRMYLAQVVWTWSGTCHNLFNVRWASIFRGVHLVIRSGLPCIRFKMDDSFSILSTWIIQRDAVEFLTRENEAPTEIHRRLLAFSGEDNCGQQYGASLGVRIEG